MKKRGILTLFVMFLIFLVPSAFATINDDLVANTIFAYEPVDNTLETITGLNGVANGTVFSASDGCHIAGTGCLLFNGVDLITINMTDAVNTEVLNLNANKSYSFTFWVNYTNGTLTSTESYMITDGSDDENALSSGIGHIKNDQDNGDGFFSMETVIGFHDQGGATDLACGADSGDQTITEDVYDTWAFWHIIYNATDKSYHQFINLVTAQNPADQKNDFCNNATLTRPNNMFIGNTKDIVPFPETHFFQGGIQSFYIFDRQITPTEIDFLFNSGTGAALNFTPPPPPPITAAVVFSEPLDRVVNVGASLAMLLAIGGLFGFFKLKGKK